MKLENKTYLPDQFFRGSTSVTVSNHFKPYKYSHEVLACSTAAISGLTLVMLLPLISAVAVGTAVTNCADQRTTCTKFVDIRSRSDRVSTNKLKWLPNNRKCSVTRIQFVCASDVISRSHILT